MKAKEEKVPSTKKSSSQFCCNANCNQHKRSNGLFASSYYAVPDNFTAKMSMVTESMSHRVNEIMDSIRIQDYQTRDPDQLNGTRKRSQLCGAQFKEEKLEGISIT